MVLDTLVHVHRRHLAKMRDASLDVSLNEIPRPHVSNLLAEAHSPTQRMLRAELAVKVGEVLGSMDHIDRQVLVMRHYEQLTNQEVARLLGLKKAAASRRYTRATKRFREVIANDPKHDPNLGYWA